MKTPANLLYARTDEWIKVEGKIATLGISDYAQNQLSDIVFVEFLAGIGDTVKAGASIATLESVKAAAEVNTPVSGKVLELNESLSQSPEVVNSDPFGQAWMLKLEIGSQSDLTKLMDAAAYEKYCAERGH
jgi:glycine cleavage system H protein